MLHALDSQEDELRNISFMALSLCAPEVCGQRLLSKNWKADAADAFAAHYGSGAVARGSKTFSFEDVQALIAPWRWLDAAVARGNQPSELQSVSVSLVRLVLSAAGEIADLPGELSMRIPEKGGLPSISITESKQREISEREFFRKMEARANLVFSILEDQLTPELREKLQRAVGTNIMLTAYEIPEGREHVRPEGLLASAFLTTFEAFERKLEEFPDEDVVNVLERYVSLLETVVAECQARFAL